MSVVIDNESGKIVGEFQKPRGKAAKPKAPKAAKPKRAKRQPVSAMVQSDLEVALGAAQRIFDTADHIARIIGGKGR